MKITGDDTRMIEISPSEFVHVLGEAIECDVRSRGDLLTLKDWSGEGKMERLRGKRVLILELVDPCQ